MKVDHLLARMFQKNVTVKDFISLKGDASSRRYHRVIFENGITPQSLIVMELPADSLKSDEITSGEQPKELPFLNVGRFMAEAGLPTPKVLLDAVDDGALLLEDLGDETFAKRVHSSDETQMEKWYCAAVDLMVQMHDVMWPIHVNCQAKKQTFDYNLLRWELDHYREWGVEAAKEITLDKDLKMELDNAFDDLAKEIASFPQGFVHRDYQSRNLMITGTEPTPKNLSIIDFQDALAGPRIYDLVALLNDSYVDLTYDMQLKLIDRYAAGRNLDKKELYKEFNLITIQRKLKDAGRFVYIDRVRGNPSFLPFVNKSFSRVKNALARLTDHNNLKTVLAKVDPAVFG